MSKSSSLAVVVLVFAVLSVAQGQNFRHLHHIPIGTPRPIEFHGLQRLDLDDFRPPEEGKAFGALARDYDAIEGNLRDEIRRQINQVKSVETEFLESDLHKEALAMKLREVV
jgi:hypothetical protein